MLKKNASSCFQRPFCPWITCPPQNHLCTLLSVLYRSLLEQLYILSSCTVKPYTVPKPNRGMWNIMAQLCIFLFAHAYFFVLSLEYDWSEAKHYSSYLLFIRISLNWNRYHISYCINNVYLDICKKCIHKCEYFVIYQFLYSVLFVYFGF